MRFTFKDLTEHSSPSYFAHPNEHPQTLYEMALKVSHIDTTLSICSAGEAPLLGFLPLTHKRLVAVDHSYKSLKVAMLKALILEHHEDVKRVYNFDHLKFEELCKGLNDELPPKLKKVELRWDNGFFASREYGHIARSWLAAPKERLDAARERLHLVEFVHADLRKVGEGFDFLYISNAIKHTGYDGHYPKPEGFISLVRDGGFILSADKSYYLHDWGKLVPAHQIKRKGNSLTDEVEWDYNLRWKPFPKEISCSQPTTSLSSDSASSLAAR